MAETERRSTQDHSNGWEAVAQWFIGVSRQSTIGVATVQAWARTLPPGASVLDLGCGPGTPRSDPINSAGFTVCAVDAAPSMVKAYRSRFPNARVACEPVEDSPFFGETFNGVLAWRVLFLLPATTQRDLIHRVASALQSDGRLLFTSPAQACSWADLSTGRQSLSLGADAYEVLLAEAELKLLAQHQDEGENHYYEALKS